MANVERSKKRFIQYLAGLAIAAAPGASALAGPPPVPSSHTKVEFASNLSDKLAPMHSPEPAARPNPRPYEQIFGDVYVQTTFTQVQVQPSTGSDVAVSTMAPSEAFERIART